MESGEATRRISVQPRSRCEVNTATAPATTNSSVGTAQFDPPAASGGGASPFSKVVGKLCPMRRLRSMAELLLTAPAGPWASSAAGRRRRIRIRRGSFVRIRRVGLFGRCCCSRVGVDEE